MGIHFAKYNFLAVHIDNEVEEDNLLSSAEELQRRTYSKSRLAVVGRIRGWEDTLAQTEEVGHMDEVQAEAVGGREENL